MKIIAVHQFDVEEGAYKSVELPLDERPGLFFRVVTNTFSTPPFTANIGEVPVQMLHDDRATYSVTMTAEGNTLKINQVYQQAESGFLITEANDDWTDTPEYRAIIIDALTLDVAVMNGGSEENIVPSVHNAGVYLRIGNTSSGGVYSQSIKTVDGNSYVFPISWIAHNAGTAQNPNYDYHYAEVPRMITVYGKG